MGNPIWSGPISNYLDFSRKRLYDQAVQELKVNKYDDDGSDDDFPGQIYNLFLEKILHNIRNLGHGGTIVIVPQEIKSNDPRLVDRILIKYKTNYNFAWDNLVRLLVNFRRYYDQYFPLTSGDKEITIETFNKFTSLQDEKDYIEEENQDIAKSIASSR